MTIPDAILTHAAAALAAGLPALALGYPVSTGRLWAGVVAFARWLGPTARSIAGRVNWSEFGRATLAGSTAGTGWAGYLGAYRASLGSIFDAQDAAASALVGVAFTLMDLGRRSLHGPKPAKAACNPSPALAPSPPDAGS